MQVPYDLYEFHQFNGDSVKCLIDKIGIPTTVVELGVYKGHFTINMLHSMCPINPDYKHYAVDPFEAYNEYDQTQLDDVMRAFESNVEQCPFRNNVQFIMKKSSDAIIDLINLGVKADLVYIDGDHRAAAVLQDLVLSWGMLNVGGAVLLDDAVNWCYTDDRREKPLQMSPRLAVDSFIHCFWDKIEVVHLPNGYQSAFIKRAH